MIVSDRKWAFFLSGSADLLKTRNPESRSLFRITLGFEIAKQARTQSNTGSCLILDQIDVIVIFRRIRCLRSFYKWVNLIRHKSEVLGLRNLNCFLRASCIKKSTPSGCSFSRPNKIPETIRFETFEGTSWSIQNWVNSIRPPDGNLCICFRRFPIWVIVLMAHMVSSDAQYYNYSYITNKKYNKIIYSMLIVKMHHRYLNLGRFYNKSIQIADEALQSIQILTLK